jgi:hypothetical protein
MTTARVYVGVDGSKDQLDVCVRRGEAQRHADDNSLVVPHDDALGSTTWSLVSSRSALSW